MLLPTKVARSCVHAHLQRKQGALHSSPLHHPRRGSEMQSGGRWRCSTDCHFYPTVHTADEAQVHASIGNPGHKPLQQTTAGNGQTLGICITRRVDVDKMTC